MHKTSPSSVATNGRSAEANKPTKSNIACDRCRDKKIKCDGSKPCKSCVNSTVDCFYSRTTRRYRGSSKEKAARLQERLWQAERLLKTAGLKQPPPASTPPNPPPASEPNTTVEPIATVEPNATGDPCPVSLANVRVEQTPVPLPYSTQVPLDFSSYNRPTYGSGLAIGLSLSDEPIFSVSNTSLPLVNVFQNQCVESDLRGENGKAARPIGREHIHGPGSFLSVCENPAVEWMTSRIGPSDYDTNSTSLVASVLKRLKLTDRISQQRTPEPPADVAWAYTKAYFEESVEASYYTIDRTKFESRLKNNDPWLATVDDPVWYALRNIVYASGCRIVTFKTHPWVEAQVRAQGYFENALSVETDLLHGTPNIMAVQALLVMALFADGSGSPKLEKMLLTCAVQLAEFCGLHLRPQISDAPFAEEQNRRWVFWALYVYDKHLALRSGRPSRIDDDDISCELPTWAPDGNNEFLECFRLYIDQAKLTSIISKAFLTLKARRLPLIEKANLVRQVDKRLRDWYNNMPDKFKTMALAEPHTLPPGIRIEHILYLHFSYHGNLAATHSIFGHPWNVDLGSGEEDQAIRDQIKTSDEALADSARNIILATRWVAIDAAAHVWLVFFFPLLGIVNMFVSILKHPEAPTTAEDICLIDVAAGYFAYLEYSTNSALWFQYIRNVAQWARQAAVKAQDELSSESEQESSLPYVHDPDTVQTDEGDAAASWGLEDFNFDFPMDMGEWPAILPRLPQF